MITTGYVYSIQSSIDTSFSYIGSTFQSLDTRFKKHLESYKQWRNDPSKRSKLSIYDYFTRYGIETFDIKLIKSYDVYRAHNKDFKHLYVYELLWIRNTKNSINLIMPFNPLSRSKIYYRSRYQRNKEKKLAYQNMYNETNKEKHKQQRNIRNQIKISCPNCGKIVRKCYLNQHKKSMKCSLKQNLIPICCL